jgi:hypothetical protein
VEQEIEMSKVGGDGGIRSILMKVITRQLTLESEFLALRSILNKKGIVTDAEITELQDAVKRFEEELHARAGRSQAELLQEILHKFEGPKQ